MMLDNGADVNAKDYKAGTPFTWALTSGTVSRIKFLLERNVEVEFSYQTFVRRSCHGTEL
jgi:hypothetical protein